MKQITAFSILLALVITAKAQITLEHTYPQTGTYNYLFNTYLSGYGSKYYKTNYNTDELILYNMDHTVFKKIPLPQPFTSPMMAFWVTNTLFDLDASTIEFAINYYNSNPYQRVIKIYNENGQQLWSSSTTKDAVLYSMSNDPYPIKNILHTEEGSKMVLHYSDGTVEVYSLPGTFHNHFCQDSVDITLKDTLYLGNVDTIYVKDTACCNSTDTVYHYSKDTVYVFQYDSVFVFNSDTIYIFETDTIYINEEDDEDDDDGHGKTMIQSHDFILKVISNPSDQTIQINYNLPFNKNQGTIFLFNSLGILLDSYQANGEKGTVSISNSLFSSGTYIITLITTDGLLKSKRLVVIR